MGCSEIYNIPKTSCLVSSRSIQWLIACNSPLSGGYEDEPDDFNSFGHG
jgi:hypothetical protein